MALVSCQGRPAHLRLVHEELISLGESDRRRLGVIASWQGVDHHLTYRQVERTFGLLARAYEGERKSTRTKGLVDLALVAEISSLDARTLRRDIRGDY